jgi:uncharacterized protein YcbK (DUF882 family)
MLKKQAIQKLKPIIDNLAEKHNWIKGKKSLVMAQVLLESGYLKHCPNNNCLGIKWTSKYPVSRKQMLWTYEYVNGKYIKVQAPFLTFESLEQCIEEGYIRVLSLSRYKPVRDSIDWWDATAQIKYCGYATSKNYTENLRKLILDNKIYEIDFRHNPEEDLTEDFKYKETFSNVRIGSKTYRRVIENPPEYDDNRINLFFEIQVVRDVISKPIVVTPMGCNYRINQYNAQIGGASKSQHLTASAADISVRGYTGYSLYQKFKELTDIKGYGISSKNWIHVDIRSKPAIWYY